MIKCKTVSIVTLLLFIQQISPVAGGMFLYRYNNKNDVEFLFTLDPSHSENMKGFDYPGGTIGPEKKNQFESNEIDGFLSPKGSFDYNNPYTFLRGAIREMLEELVFLPIDLLQVHKEFTPPTENSQAYVPPIEYFSESGYQRSAEAIDTKYEKVAIDTLENHIKNNGIFFIYKRKTAGNNPWDKAAVFFLDITLICPPNLPEDLVKKRILLQTQGFRLRNIDAEPVAFAWVTGNDILKFIAKNNLNWIDYTQYAEHDEKTNKLQNSNNTNYPDLVNLNTKKIKISNICIEMMKDRIDDKDNPQPDIVVIRRPHDIIYFDDLKKITRQNPPTQSSSMRGVINFLQNHRNELKLTSAPPPPPPAPKFDVQDWIEKNTNGLKQLIENEIKTTTEYLTDATIAQWIKLQNIIGASKSDIKKIENHIIELFINHQKALSNAQKPLHPLAKIMTTQALELASLL